MRHIQLKQANFACPICQQPLKFTISALVCDNKHAFDIAKESYVNLLPVQHKKSKQPGDNKAMVTARRRFLATGFYSQLKEALSELFLRHGNLKGNVLDAGCGEGYYTDLYTNSNAQVYGVDIAKEAVKLAAKTYKSNIFCVGSVFQLPFPDELFTWVNSVYAPISEAELTRVLCSNGYIVSVTPGADHLSELKRFLYQTPTKHDESKVTINNLKLISERRLTYTMDALAGTDAVELIKMTPFAYKLSTENEAEMTTQNAIPCTADFIIRLFQK